MSVVSGRHLGLAVVKALGLTGSIRRITIDMSVDSIASITVERYVEDKDADGLVPVLTRYELVEKVDEGR
jgi:hypothetical protein